MSPWHTYCWLTALLAAATFIVVQQGVVAWFLEHFSSPITLSVSAAMLLVFATVFFAVGAPAGKMLHREYLALADIEDKLAAPNVDSREVVRKILAESYNGPTVTRSTLRMLSKFLSYRSQSCRPVDKELLIDLYEEKIMGPVSVIEHYRQLLFYLGLLGTVGGVIYALAVGTIPQTAEEVRMFSFTTLEGLGVSYTSTFFGMGGAVVLYLLVGRYERWVNEISWTLRVLLEEILIIVEREACEEVAAAEEVPK
ncbi:hypothetical protein COU20_03880 [Candidatus Kaiserbacteria bacterium CG10_big_fil_rev_8_21_14_0_10_59_10]|uniref:MotA/TolQ/ExbB proton channel domain-containing protein n=1 Tax=Candidatus Kaiserbacteria bacterium CG10_big_fil_rev_8_21_14_0_10_59_10 TaxID=1974612 RepID=A0A2H0U931_9BACT|nr:MAG: hypothetical protein COU20_03880 [Candidatus Kaiserbacteria bacterium CG10_big_fil_rev_8_21_14_0_10_59_10]